MAADAAVNGRSQLLLYVVCQLGLTACRMRSLELLLYALCKFGLNGCRMRQRTASPSFGCIHCVSLNDCKIEWLQNPAADGLSQLLLYAVCKLKLNGCRMQQPTASPSRSVWCSEMWGCCSGAGMCAAWGPTLQLQTSLTQV